MYMSMKVPVSSCIYLESERAQGSVKSSIVYVNESASVQL